MTPQIHCAFPSSLDFFAGHQHVFTASPVPLFANKPNPNFRSKRCIMFENNRQDRFYPIAAASRHATTGRRCRDQFRKRQNFQHQLNVAATCKHQFHRISRIENSYTENPGRNSIKYSGNATRILYNYLNFSLGTNLRQKTTSLTLISDFKTEQSQSLCYSSNRPEQSERDARLDEVEWVQKINRCHVEVTFADSFPEPSRGAATVVTRLFRAKNYGRSAGLWWRRLARISLNFFIRDGVFACLQSEVVKIELMATISEAKTNLRPVDGQ